MNSCDAGLVRAQERCWITPESSLSRAMIEAFISGWKRTFDYEGRSKRPDFWWFYLADTIILVILVLLGLANELLMKLYVLYAIAQIFPTLSLTVRRLRDAGKAWPWIFIGFVPLIGGIWLIVLLAQPSLGTPALPI